uniref:Ig-like domain-containing protein n=1 Tax=Cyprinodon variegatus TaxID=28743 RepID=A0A3Q2FIY8_CYPVA
HLLLVNILHIKQQQTHGKRMSHKLPPVNALVGHNTILPCHTKGQLDVTNQAVEWRFQNSTSPELKVHVYRSRGDQPLDQHQKYKDRTSLFKDEMKKGNISLKLNNVTKQDQGNYSCIVLLKPKIKSTVTLIVGKFQNSTSPELKVHVYRSRGDQPLDQDEKYKDRTSLFKDEMTKGNISLKLINVTKEDEGNYTCIVVRKPKIKSSTPYFPHRLLEIGPTPTVNLTDKQHKVDGWIL